MARKKGAMPPPIKQRKMTDVMRGAPAPAPGRKQSTKKATMKRGRSRFEK
jgi:hypothetical protein